MDDDEPLVVWRCPEADCDWWGEEPYWTKDGSDGSMGDPLCQIGNCPGICEPYEAFPVGHEEARS